MTQQRPLTSEEIDDGWCLEEAPPPQAASDEEDPYLEILIEERPPSSAFEQAFWEQHEGKKLARGFGEDSPTFGKMRRVRGTFPPYETGN